MVASTVPVSFVLSEGKRKKKKMKNGEKKGGRRAGGMEERTELQY